MVSNNGVALSPHNQWLIDLLEVVAAVMGATGASGVVVAVAGVIGEEGASLVLVDPDAEAAPVDGVAVDGVVVVSVAVVLAGAMGLASKVCACAVMVM